MSSFRVVVLLVPVVAEILHQHHEHHLPLPPAGVVLARPEQLAQPHVHEDSPGPRVPDLPVAVVSGAPVGLSYWTLRNQFVGSAVATSLT